VTARDAVSSRTGLGWRSTRRATSNLDLPTATELADALNAYRGALIVAGHHHHFPHRHPHDADLALHNAQHVPVQTP